MSSYQFSTRCILWMGFFSCCSCFPLQNINSSLPHPLTTSIITIIFRATFFATLPTLIFTLFFAVSHKMPPVKRCWSVVNLTSLTPSQGRDLPLDQIRANGNRYFFARIAAHLGCSFVFIWPRPPVANLVNRTGGYVSVCFGRVFRAWFSCSGFVRRI